VALGLAVAALVIAIIALAIAVSVSLGRQEDRYWWHSERDDLRDQLAQERQDRQKGDEPGD
jgi:hypothetical protein